MHALRHLGRCQWALPFIRRLQLKRLYAVADLVKLFEEAFKQQPDNDELGRQAFFANVRAGNWKAAQLVRPSVLWITGAARATSQTTSHMPLWNPVTVVLS
jgi:hypothetical protein